MSTAHSPTFPSLHLRHSSFSNSSVALTTSQFKSLTFPSVHLRHSSFSNPSVASTTSQLILQPFFRFSYVTGSSLTWPGEPPMIEINYFDQFFSIIIHLLKILYILFKCFTSKSNVLGTFWYLRNKINLKMIISETNIPIELKFCKLSIFKV